MTFLSPPTAKAGKKVKSAWWNKFVRDNFNHLHDEQPQWLIQKRTTENFIKNNSISVELIPGLSFSIEQKEVWWMLAFIHFNSPAAADIRFEVSSAFGSEGRWGSANELNLKGAPIGTLRSFATDGNDQAMILSATVRNVGIGAGDVEVLAAQNIATTSNTTVYKDSSLVAVRLF